MWCRACGEEIPVHGRVPFRERCPKCDAPLHACLNCRFHDPGAYNQCRENRAERQVDKQRENRCEYFEPAARPGETGPAGAGAKDRQAFEALFGKPPAGEGV